VTIGPTSNLLLNKPEYWFCTTRKQ